MTVVLTPTAEYKVSTRDGLWMSAADAGKVTGWTLKPEGMCRDERCVPLPAGALKSKDGDPEAFWQKLGGPGIASPGGDAWALGAPPRERHAALGGVAAPDLTLPGVDGTPRRP